MSDRSRAAVAEKFAILSLMPLGHGSEMHVKPNACDVWFGIEVQQGRVSTRGVHWTACNRSRDSLWAGACACARARRCPRVTNSPFSLLRLRFPDGPLPRPAPALLSPLLSPPPGENGCHTGRSPRSCWQNRCASATRPRQEMFGRPITMRRPHEERCHQRVHTRTSWR